MARRVHGIPEINLFAEKLRAVPKEQRKRVRKAVYSATAHIRQDMARRAAWSSRIPAAIGMRIAFGQAKVQIKVDSNRAPHARPYEGLSQGRTFRAPLFGDKRYWYPRSARPFFFPAFNAGRQQVVDAIELAIIQSLPR